MTHLSCCFCFANHQCAAACMPSIHLHECANMNSAACLQQCITWRAHTDFFSRWLEEGWDSCHMLRVKKSKHKTEDKRRSGAHRGQQKPSRARRRTTLSISGRQRGPKRPHEIPKTTQRASKTSPRSPKVTSREPQNAFKTIIGCKTLLFQKSSNVFAEPLFLKV